LRQLFDIACSRHQFLFEPILTSNYVEALHKLVMHSDAITISGEVSVRYRVADNELVMVPVRERGFDARQIEVQTLIGITLPRIVEIFLDYLLKNLGTR
jgi:hypothetical protein